FIIRVTSISYCVALTLSQFYCFIFFFFQAEDGIRDATVTGVQTCALPISILQLLSHGDRQSGLADAARTGEGDQPDLRRRQQGRSEERRVGKSVDLGGGSMIKKKKGIGRA